VSFRGECLVFSFRKSTVYVYMTYYKWYNIWYDICYDVIKYNIMAYSTIQSTGYNIASHNRRIWWYML
jgi:hypothetical protein